MAETDAARTEAKQLLAHYAPLFWQAGLGKFAGQTFTDHEGIERSVADTLQISKFDLERAQAGNLSGLRCARRDMARLEGVLK